MISASADTALTHDVYAKARFNMVESQIRTNKVTDSKLLAAMSRIPRQIFVPAGLAGVMSGLALADAMNVIFRLRAANRSEEAFQLYEKLLPFIVFGWQNFELWLYCEKRLLQARGLLTSARCRDASIAPDPNTVRYVDEICERVMRALENSGLSAKS